MRIGTYTRGMYGVWAGKYTRGTYGVWAGHNIGVGGSREEGSGTPHEHPFRTGPTHKGGLSVHTAATTVTSKALNPGWHCVV